VTAHSGLLLNECADLLATRGIFNQAPPNGTPQTVTVVGEDTVNEEYTIQDRDETLDTDWKADHPPARTVLCRDGDVLSIRPPTPDALSESAFRHMAEHPATSLFAHRTPAAVPDSESEPESDTRPQAPEDEGPRPPVQTIAPPTNQPKPFGLGCEPIGTFCEEPRYLLRL
jgi:hypothetical protein